METTTLQIPKSKKLRDAATAAAKEQGFSSLQEVVRVLLGQMMRKEIVVGFTRPEHITLSPAAKRRYKKMIDEFKKGKKTRTFETTRDLMDYLNS